MCSELKALIRGVANAAVFYLAAAAPPNPALTFRNRPLNPAASVRRGGCERCWSWRGDGKRAADARSRYSGFRSARRLAAHPHDRITVADDKPKAQCPRKRQIRKSRTRERKPPRRKAAQGGRRSGCASALSGWSIGARCSACGRRSRSSASWSGSARICRRSSRWKFQSARRPSRSPASTAACWPRAAKWPAPMSR